MALLGFRSWVPDNNLTWYCGGTGGRAWGGAAESVAAEDGAGGRGTGCLGCRGPGAELPPTETGKTAEAETGSGWEGDPVHAKRGAPRVQTQASPGRTRPRTSTMCRGSWLTSAGACNGSSRAGGAAFSKRSRSAGSFLGETMEKWIPRCRKGQRKNGASINGLGPASAPLPGETVWP